jgi:SAM-dependent methyltransferase
MDESLVARYPQLERKHFWWATRRTMVSELVGDLFSETSPAVLDVGCGSGLTGEMLVSHGASVLGVDMQSHPESMEIDFVKGDYLSLFDQLGTFDVVLALDAIEHFEDETQVLAALAFNLRPGGRLVVTVPAYRFLWSSHDEENLHYRRYTRRSLTRALRAANLNVDRIGYVFMALVLPKLILKVLERITSREAPTGTGVEGLANTLASKYFDAETRFALRRANFLPFGTSVVAVAGKPAAS